MVQSAFVYRVGSSGSEYLGKRELDLPLRAEEINSYVHRRERQVVRVDRIEPVSWNPNSGVLPTVYVSAATVEGRGPMPSWRKKRCPMRTAIPLRTGFVIAE